MSILEEIGRTLAGVLWPASTFARAAFTSFRENGALLMVSLGLSLVLWIYVNNETNPARTDVFPAALPLAVRNLPSTTQVTSAPATVQVQVNAPQDVWARLRATNFTAWVDLAGAAPGTVERDVQVETNEPQIRVAGVLPGRVQIRLEAVGRKSVSVRSVLEGALPFGFTYEPARITPSTVSVTGPSSLLDQIDSAAVEIRIEGARVSISETFPVFATTAQGNRVNGVTISPDSVNVSLDVTQQVHYRAVSVTPTIRGTPAAGFWLRNVASDPAVVTIVGDRATLDGINFLRTVAVDITGARTDVQRAVELDLPRGVSLTDQSLVTVTAAISPQQGTTRIVIAPVSIGLKPGEEATVRQPVELTLSGDLPLLQGLDPSAVTATLDLTNLEPGTYDIAPVLTLPAGLTVTGVSPARLSVTIRAVPPVPTGGG